MIHAPSPAHIVDYTFCFTAGSTRLYDARLPARCFGKNRICWLIHCARKRIIVLLLIPCERRERAVHLYRTSNKWYLTRYQATMWKEKGGKKLYKIFISRKNKRISMKCKFFFKNSFNLFNPSNVAILQIFFFLPHY